MFRYVVRFDELMQQMTVDFASPMARNLVSSFKYLGTAFNFNSLKMLMLDKCFEKPCEC